MSDELEDNRGVFRTAAWHDKGKIPEQKITDLQEFLQIGDMNFDVEKVPALIGRMGPDENGEIKPFSAEVPGQFHLMRGDDGKVVSAHTVSRHYNPVSPKQIAEIIGGFTSEGFATPDAAFTLYDGQSEVVSLALDYQEDAIEKDSKWNHFLVVQNLHGGLGKLRGKLTSIRVVCHNTVTAAFRGGAEFDIRHSSGVIDRAKFAIDNWKSLKEYIRDMGEKYNKLQAFPVDVPVVVDSILGISGMVADDIPKQTIRRRDAIIAAASNSPGTEGKTAADIFNAVTYYTKTDESGRGGKDERQRFASTLDGTRAKFQQAALDKLLVMAGAD